MLPWQRLSSPIVTQTEYENSESNSDINPGEYVLQTLFNEFTLLAQNKIDRIMEDSLERPLTKFLQRGEDPQFDQLLTSLHSVAEHCLSSILKTLFLWYERQIFHSSEDYVGVPKSPNRLRSGSESPRPGSRASFKEKDLQWERRDFAVEFIFCLVLIEVLKQLNVHPVDDSLIQYIENLAFKHFKEHHANGSISPTACDQTIVTALYAEVLGVLAQTRFQSIKKKFLLEYKENSSNPQILLNITMGLKFIRIKLYPVSEVEEFFMFLQECGNLFLEKSLDKEVKYAFASLFVEVLIPVAATAKREYNLPAVKKFVDILYKEVFDMSKKAKHSLAIYPLVTALLCVSQKQFFLSNWGHFLNICLNSIKSRDIKMQRMGMECLYRLIWVYIIRIKCEPHTVTMNRLRSVAETLFPKNSRTILPRNIPLTIFVKIIQFIAQEKLDFAMQDIIFDLLNIGKNIKQLNPERMNIGLRAFLVIADTLQRNEGSPPMPSTIAHLPSGNTLKVKKTFTKLTEEAARNIGVVTYYTNVRKALDTILKSLDSQVGKNMILVNPQMVNKEVNDLMTSERKPKIDLFRTCVAAIPKCIPDGMGKVELVEMVSRLTLHMDEELRNLAFAALQGLIVDFPEYRQDIICGYIFFTLKEIPDSFPQTIENSMRMLAQLLNQWRSALVHPASTNTDKFLEMSMHCSKSFEDEGTSFIHTLHVVEGFSLTMLCSNKAMHRKLAFTLLKEVRLLYRNLYPEGKDDLVADIVEKSASVVVEKALANVSGYDKSSLGLTPHIDLHLLAEKSALLAEKQQHDIGNSLNRDLWSHCLSGFFNKIFVNTKHCSCIYQCIWPYINNRIFTIFSLIDPNADFDSMKSKTSVMSFRAPRVQANLSDICLWRNYLIYLFSTPPPLANTSLNATVNSAQNESELKFDLSKLNLEFPRLSDVFRTTVLLIRSERYEIRETAVVALGKTNPHAHPYLVEELQSLIKEVLDKKAEGVRKKRRRDLLRVQVTRIMAANAENGCFRYSLSQNDNKGILQVLGEYIEGMRSILELENGKDECTLMQLRLFFSKFLHKMIKSIPTSMQSNLLRNQGRHHLFLLLASWCGHFNVTNLGTSTYTGYHSLELEFSALEAMCALLCCGHVFDQKALTVSNGYLYKFIDTMLQSSNAKVVQLGQDTVELLLDNNEGIPALLNFILDRCYSGGKSISNGCFLAIANLCSKRSYNCQTISMLCATLFKIGDSCHEIKVKATQLLYILDRRFFPFMIPFQMAGTDSAHRNHDFSMQMALTHPEITLPVISEITLRLESATRIGQRTLLHCLSPWLRNIELCHDNEGLKEFNEIITNTKNISHLKPVSLKGHGWGSSHASQMVLNNLWYLTVKYQEFYSDEIEDCWSSLCVCWEKNVAKIISYLIVMAGLCGTPVLAHAKKIVLYLARSKTEAVIHHLTAEMKSTEIITSSWERMDCPPYFRCLTKTCSTSSSASTTQSFVIDASTSLKSNVDKLDCFSEFSSELGKSNGDNDATQTDNKSSEVDQESYVKSKKFDYGMSDEWIVQWVAKVGEDGLCIPLPLPQKLQYFAPITTLFPLTSSPAQLYRCNFALILLTEIVSDQRDIEWMSNLPLLLHVSFLGLDHPKPLVHENCKRLIINLLVVLICGKDRSVIAKALMGFYTVSYTDQTASVRSSCVSEEEMRSVNEHETMSENVAAANSPNLDEHYSSVDDRVQDMIEYLAKSDCKPLWSYEDITPRNCCIKSSNQLESFVQNILLLFNQTPGSFLSARWGREALHWATSCSSRHYAGRSFQIFRALKVPLSWPMLSDILQRLIESVADSSEDVQGYFMEILHTFIVEVEFAFTSSKAESNESPGISCQNDQNHPPDVEVQSRRSEEHKNRSSIVADKEQETEEETVVRDTTDTQLPESPFDILARFFWIAVSLLESDYEHEFLLAVKLLTSVLESLNLQSPLVIERIDVLFKRLNWTNFPGVQNLLLKGLTSTSTTEQTHYLLANLTALNTVSVINPCPESGLSLNIIALLPRLILNFDEPDSFCQLAASNIDQVCDSNNKLADLATLFRMYKEREYPKAVQFWIEVVCKNLTDNFPQCSTQLLALLVEMLEQGLVMFQQAVLTMICTIVKYADSTRPGFKQFYVPLLRTISSHLKDSNLWKESLHILKLVVSNSSQIHQIDPPAISVKSSQISHPRSSLASLSSIAPKINWGQPYSFAESSWSLSSSHVFQKDLPGRTLEFTYNVSKTPVIGAEQTENKDVTTNSPAAPCWRKPHNSQRRTRERLLQLLPLCGHKGGLKQSLSVIFSSSSELELEKPLSSEEGSGDEQSGDDEFSGQLTKIFTDFDFLDDELDKDVEVGSFGWTSNTELAEEFAENGHISPCDSESDNAATVKDGEISADEDETDNLKKSLQESSMRYLDEEKADEVASKNTIVAECSQCSDENLSLHQEQTPSELSNAVEFKSMSENMEEGAPNSSLTSQSSLDSNHGVVVLPTSQTFGLTVFSFEDIPDQWSKMIKSFVSGPSVEEAIDSLPCFPMVLKMWNVWLLRVLKDAQSLFMVGGLINLASKLTAVEEALENDVKLPYIFMGHKIFTTEKMLFRHRSTALKLNVCLQGLEEKRQQVQEQLDVFQMSYKNEYAINDKQMDFFCLRIDDQAVFDLSHNLYRLYMQYAMCLEIYVNYLEKIASIVHSVSNISDVTSELKSIRSELLAVQSSISGSNKEDCEAPLLNEEIGSVVCEAVANGHYDEAILIVRMYRMKHPFLSTLQQGVDEEVETVLSVYARSIVKTQAGVFAVLGSYEQMFCDKLTNLLADFLLGTYNNEVD